MIDRLKPYPITVYISWDKFAYVAQCEPYDIFTQGKDIPEVLSRLSNQYAAEIAIAGSLDNIPLRDTTEKTASEILKDPVTFDLEYDDYPPITIHTNVQIIQTGDNYYEHTQWEDPAYYIRKDVYNDLVAQNLRTPQEKREREQRYIKRGHRIEKAIDLATSYGGIDGAHHKDWVIDQMVRILSGDRYEQLIRETKNGEDGPNTYEWSIGVAP